MSRRNSKAYDQPILESVGPDQVPSVHVEDSCLSDHRSSCVGNLRELGSFRLGSIMAKCGVAILVVCAAISRVLGESYLTSVSQFFGFTLIFVVAFFLCCGLFAWWGVWGRDGVGLSSRKVVIIYGICIASEIASIMLDQYIDLGALEQLPVNVSLYAVLGLSLLSSFSVFVHPGGVAAMFSNESSSFVGLVLLLHFSMSALFYHSLPLLIYGQLVHTSCFLGLTLSLMLKEVQPRFRLSKLRKLVWGSQSKHSLRVPPRGRKISNISDLPSSHYTQYRNSLSSQSSLTSSIPASVSVDLWVSGEGGVSCHFPGQNVITGGGVSVDQSCGW